MREKTGAAAVVMAFPVACAVAGLFTGCDKTPTGPTTGPPRVVADPAPPTPAYSLTGYVHEAGLMVDGARVEVTTGVGAPLTTFTGFWGRYDLRVVSGEATVRVTKNGYLPAAETIVVTDDQRYDIELRLPGPRRDLQGIYTMTITAANHCAVGRGEGHLPEEARVRSYRATVRQDGPRLEVTLSGATFWGGGGDVLLRYYGRVEPERVVFDFTWYDGEGPVIVEQLSTSRLLIVSGIVAAVGPDSRLAGMLTGRIEAISETNDEWAHYSWCDSTSHQFVLSR
jgi:Carboxypeptidase regulatory-like domain